MAEELLPRGIGSLAHGVERLRRHLGLEIGPGTLDAGEGESEAHLERALPPAVTEADYGHLVLLVVLHPDVCHLIVCGGIEVDAALAVLESGQRMVVHLVDVIAAWAAVVAGDIDEQMLLVLGAEGVAVQGTAQRGGELGHHAVTLQEDAVVAGMGLLVPVAEVGGIVARIEVSRHGHHGQMEQVPVPLAGVGKAVHLVVFVLIACPAVVHRHGRCLYHSVGQRTAGRHLAAPCTLRLGVRISQVLGQPQGGGAQEGVHITRQALGLRPCGQQEQQAHCGPGEGGCGMDVS